MPHDHVRNKFFFLTIGYPQGPPSPTPGASPRHLSKNSVRFVLYLLFVRTHTKFCIKSLKLTLLLKFNDIWPFDPSPGPKGAGLFFFAVACPIHVSNSHTKFSWISSNGLGGDSIKDSGDNNIPIAF